MGGKSKSKSNSTQNSPALNEEEESKIQKKFHLDISERVLYIIKARKKHRNGTLSITEDHLCFQSHLLGTSKKKLLAFNQISKIENQEKDAGVRITTKQGKVITFHFKQNESVYFLIEGQWEASGNHPGTRLNISTESTNRVVIDSHSLHKHFQLPDSERTITEVTCSLKSTVKVKHYGKLFLTQNYICFYSRFLASTTKRIIKLKNITSIEKSDEKRIYIHTPKDTFKFSTFINRDETFDLFQGVMEKAKADDASLPPTPLLRSRNNSVESGLNNLENSSGSKNGSRRNSLNPNTTLDANKLQEELEKQKSKSENNSTYVFKKNHSRQSSENNNHSSTTASPLPSITTTNPTTLSNPSPVTIKVTSLESKPISPTTTPVVVQPSPTSAKLSNRVDNIVLPPPEAPQPSQTKQTKVRARTCCFGF